jgi:hypothetical protein
MANLWHLHGYTHTLVRDAIFIVLFRLFSVLPTLSRKRSHFLRKGNAFYFNHMDFITVSIFDQHTNSGLRLIVRSVHYRSIFQFFNCVELRTTLSINHITLTYITSHTLHQATCSIGRAQRYILLIPRSSI